MKQAIHPKTHPVVFVDTSSGVEFISTSTLEGEETRQIDGVEHRVINVEISSASHPFYTGRQIFVDTARRVEKFQAKMEKVGKASAKRKGKKAKRAIRAGKRTLDDSAKSKEKNAGTSK